jgi:hypothetical protein
MSMQAYSLDLRQKILGACDQRLGSPRTIAALCGVSQSVGAQLRAAAGHLRHNRLSARAPSGAGVLRCHAGGVIGAAGGAARLARQCANDGAHRPPLAAAAQQKSLHADERETDRVRQARAAYQAEIAALDAARFTCLDESGVNLAMTRRYGRAPRGERVVGTVPQNYGANVTMLAALGSHGVEAVMTIDGATDAEVFRVDVAQVLRPTLRPGGHRHHGQPARTQGGGQP